MSQVGDRVVGWEGKGGHVKHVKKIQAHLWKRKKKLFSRTTAICITILSTDILHMRHIFKMSGTFIWQYFVGKQMDILCE